MPKLRIFLFIFILYLISFSCDKSQVQIIPDVPVNITININDDPEYFNLRAPGNADTINRTTGGYPVGYMGNGIIVFRYSENLFYAYDRTCPYQVEKHVAVKLVDNTFAKCPDCHSVFILAGDGLPTTAGPATYPLKKYTTTFYPGTGELLIQNN